MVFVTVGVPNTCLVFVVKLPHFSDTTCYISLLSAVTTLKPYFLFYYVLWFF